ncbi:MAG: hypothetical protein ACKN9T_10590 [Candidatus Methylumidiphilus sp.]
MYTEAVLLLMTVFFIGYKVGYLMGNRRANVAIECFLRKRQMMMAQLNYRNYV